MANAEHSYLESFFQFQFACLISLVPARLRDRRAVLLFGRSGAPANTHPMEARLGGPDSLTPGFGTNAASFGRTRFEKYDSMPLINIRARMVGGVARVLHVPVGQQEPGGHVLHPAAPGSECRLASCRVSSVMARRFPVVRLHYRCM